MKLTTNPDIALVGEMSRPPRSRNTEIKVYNKRTLQQAELYVFNMGLAGFLCIYFAVTSFSVGFWFLTGCQGFTRVRKSLQLPV